MKDVDWKKLKVMADHLDEIFKPTGYQISGFDPQFTLVKMHENTPVGSVTLPYSIAERIIEIYFMIPDDDDPYWNSSHC